MNMKKEYPKNLQAAYVLLKAWNGKAPFKQPVGIAFTNPGDEDDDGTSVLPKGTYSDPKYGRCGRVNHPTSKCHAKTREDGTVFHVEWGFEYENDGDEVSTNNKIGILSSNAYGLIFNLNSIDNRGLKFSCKGLIPNTWIFLDSQSTTNVFSNSNLLCDIHPIKTTMYIKCNAGSKSTNFRGYLSGYVWVWFFPDEIANILSLSWVKEKYHVTFDSATDNCFHVHEEDRMLKFQEAARHLFYFDTAARDAELNVFINTVSDNESKFSV